MPLPYHPVVRAVQLLGWFLLNLLIAFFGTTMLGLAFLRFRPQTIDGYLWKEWLISVGCAAVLGFFMPRTMNAPGARWVWVPVAAWFLLGLLAYAGSHQHTTALESAANASGTWWYHFGGPDCINGRRSEGCQAYFIFTTPMIRAAAYSLAAFISVRLMRRTAAHAASACSGPQ